MSFTRTLFQTNHLTLLNLPYDEQNESFIGKSFIIDTQKRVALLEVKHPLHYANYPPTLELYFFIYGRKIRISHTGKLRRRIFFRSKFITTEIFLIPIYEAISDYKKEEMQRLCENAIKLYLGDYYFGNKFKIILDDKTIPVTYSRSQLKRIKNVQEVQQKDFDITSEKERFAHLKNLHKALFK